MNEKNIQKISERQLLENKLFQKQTFSGNKKKSIYTKIENNDR